MIDHKLKMLIPPLAIDNEFFVAYFSILERCKTKGAVGEVCTLLRIWPFSAHHQQARQQNKVKLEGKGTPTTVGMQKPEETGV
jgi:hypothetical protein